MYADAREHRVREVRIQRGLRTATYGPAAMPLARLSSRTPAFAVSLRRSLSLRHPEHFWQLPPRYRFDDRRALVGCTQVVAVAHCRRGPGRTGRPAAVGDTPVDMNNVEQGTAYLPVGTVTFLLTDVEGSTFLWESAPDAMGAAIRRHYQLLDAAISLHGGVRPVEQGEGDSVVAAFACASHALAAALDIQRAFYAERWPEGAALKLRVALHTAQAQLRDEVNYFGPAVNRCARLRAVAHGGQVVLSK